MVDASVDAAADGPVGAEGSVTGDGAAAEALEPLVATAVEEAPLWPQPTVKAISVTASQRGRAGTRTAWTRRSRIDKRRARTWRCP
jgi:hypothetical protein